MWVPGGSARQARYAPLECVIFTLITELGGFGISPVSGSTMIDTRQPVCTLASPYGTTRRQTPQPFELNPPSVPKMSTVGPTPP
jgi:hypothetical protein